MGRTRRWQRDALDALERYADKHSIKLTIILYLIHVVGYLWKATEVLAGDSPSKRHQWVKERLPNILSGKCVDVAVGMRRSATLRDLSDDARKPVDTCANYLLKYKLYLCYEQFLADGLPIATSVIEGACRSLVQERMGITGAR